ncbi:MAG: cytidine deaminase [Bacilli bacterium]|nr:cytidine deaminase [Bacilli bacterium]MDD4809106.1 cytidine deaminase [Bacilli bacterium]
MNNKLKQLLENSYSPYSKFRVAAIVVMKDGTEFNGVNVENASYGATICAERSAIVSAISCGYQKGDFDKLYVMCDNDKIGMPCFICRQVLIEFFDIEDEVICFNNKGDKEVFKVKELCPYPFGEEDLK